MLDTVERMTSEEYRKHMGIASDPAPIPPGAITPVKTSKKSKWNNKPCWYESPIVGLRRYDSKREANRARKLDQMHLAGKIVAWWAQHPVYCGFDNENGSPTRMMIDFKILWPNGSVTYEDSKGPKPTRDWLIKRNAVRDLHGIEVATV